jgi:hypothetical protein
MITFELWMRSQGLSQSSVDKYVGAINGRLTTWALKHKFIERPLGEIETPSEFAAVAKMIKGTDEYLGSNRTGHHMYGAALKKFAHYLDYVSTEASSDGPHGSLLAAIEATEALTPFSPQGQEDARERILREVVQRRGQPKFRNSLIAAYEGRCAITGCPVLPILEAAHITPYLGPATNSVSNGLLLRADVHTLWDLGLIAVAPTTYTICVSPSITDPTYRMLRGNSLFQPTNPGARPSIFALEQQWAFAYGAAGAHP